MIDRTELKRVADTAAMHARMRGTVQGCVLGFVILLFMGWGIADAATLALCSCLIGLALLYTLRKRLSK